MTALSATTLSGYVDTSVNWQTGSLQPAVNMQMPDGVIAARVEMLDVPGLVVIGLPPTTRPPEEPLLMVELPGIQDIPYGVTVPEPSPLALACVGLAVLALRRRRREHI